MTMALQDVDRPSSLVSTATAFHGRDAKTAETIVMTTQTRRSAVQTFILNIRHL